MIDIEKIAMKGTLSVTIEVIMNVIGAVISKILKKSNTRKYISMIAAAPQGRVCSWLDLT